MEINKKISLNQALTMANHHKNVLQTTNVDCKPLAWLYNWECLCYYNQIIINRSRKK